MRQLLGSSALFSQRNMPFDIKVSEGQAVTKDTMIADVDLAAIKEAGKETAMMVLLTNMEHVLTFVLTHTGEVRAKTPVMDVESVK